MIDSQHQEELAAFVVEMAIEIGCKPLNKNEVAELINFVLFDSQGKNGWACFKAGLITEREIVNLFLAHCTTRIRAKNKDIDMDESKLINQDLTNKIEKLFFGRKAKLLESDVRYDWEK